MTGGINSGGGLVTDKDVNKTEHPSIDTYDSSSSRYSVDSQKPRIGPPPGTYVVELPKDQIYRIPPPENAHRYEYLSRRKTKQSHCRRCFCYSLAALLILLVLAATVVGIVYFVYSPHKPRFSVSDVSVTGINLTSSATSSPVIGIKLRSQNKGKLGLVYEKENEAEFFYDGIKLGNGGFTAFKQPANNVTVIVTVLKGSSVRLTSSLRKELTESQKKGKVPFGIRIKAPVKFKVGSVTTWTMTVTVDCKMTLDKLTASATVMTENCDTGLSLLSILS